MLDGKRVICDCCGRQILWTSCNDKYVIGREKEPCYQLDIHVHACFVCIEDPLLRDQYGLSPLK